MPTLNETPKKDENIARVEALSVDQQLQLAAASFSGSDTLEAKLKVAAISTVVARMTQLDEPDLRDLFQCIQDLGTIKTREDAEDTLKTILEILEPRGAESCHQNGLVEEQPSRQTYDSWLVWISKEIKKRRDDASMTQEELAQATGLPQSHISRLERGIHSPSSKTLKKIADALKIPVTTLNLLSE